MGYAMGDRDDELGIEDTSGLTDADWAEINKLKRAYNSGGDEELEKAMRELLQRDPVRAVRVWGAFFPNRVREALKDWMAKAGFTIEDFKELMRKAEPTKH
jgi:hypothetical protein